MFIFRYIFKPLGLSFGIKDSKHIKPSTNSVLEKEFSLTKKNKSYQINIPKVIVLIFKKETFLIELQ